MGANLPCSRGAGYGRGLAGDTGDQSVWAPSPPPAPSPPGTGEAQASSCVPPPYPPPAPPVRRKRSAAAAQMPLPQQHPRANAPPPPAAPPAASRPRRGTPGRPDTRHPHPGVGKRPRGHTVCQGLRGGGGRTPRSPGCGHPRQQPVIAPAGDPGLGSRGTRGKAEGGGEGGSRGAGAPKPGVRWAVGVPGSARMAPGTVLGALPPHPVTTGHPAQRTQGGTLPRASAGGPHHPHSPVCRAATPHRSAALAARHRPARGDGAQLTRGDGGATPFPAGQ